MQKQESTRHQDKTHHITDPRSGRQGRDSTANLGNSGLMKYR